MNIITELTLAEQDLTRQQPYFYWLYGIPGIGDRTIFRLFEKVRVPEEIFYATESELEKWQEEKILEEKQVQNLKRARKNCNLYSAYDKLRNDGIRMVPFYHPEYPGKLVNIPDRPSVLFVKGRLPAPHLKSLAIIGARSCSGYGKRMAQEFASVLGNAGVQIVSGMARGVDGISQAAALESGGSSFGVLGCGVDICYPGQNRPLYDELIKKGGVLSAYLPGTQPQSQYFPPRNRIISGLADALLVIEAREKSGTLITVDMALEQGREVYALPGRVDDPISEGCNRLIAQGAGIALSPEALLAELMGRAELPGHTELSGAGATWNLAKESTARPPVIPADLDEDEARVYQILDDYPKSLDEIWQEANKWDKSTIKICNLMGIMVKLCLRGYAEQINGSQVYIKRQK